MNESKGKKSPVIHLFLESKESWPGWGALIVLSFLSGWFSTRIAELTGELIDLGIRFQYEEMMGIGISLAVFLLCNCVRSALNYHVNAKATETMFQKIRRRMFQALTDGRLDQIEGKFQTGEMVSRLNGEVNQLCDTVAGSVAWYLRVIFEALVTIYVCLTISVELSIVYLLIMPISFFIMNTLSKTLREKQKNIALHTGNAASLVSEMLNNIATVKVFHLEKEMSTKFAKELENSKKQELQGQQIESLIVGIRYATQIIQTIVLFVAAIYFVSKGILTPGSAIAFITICTNIRTAFELSDRMITSYHRASALSERIYEVLDLPLNEEIINKQQINDGSKCLVKQEFKENGSGEFISMEAISFSYNGTRQVLHNVDLHIKKGERVGVVGPSGCGKSTLIKLICKFYSIDSGKIQMENQNLEQINRNTLYGKIALVSQEPHLFDGTIYENVANGKEGASRQQVAEVLKRVQLWNYISKLPDGMDTQIGQGGKYLSGGQAQRISIARALIKDADLILLDEPTSALDTKTEQEVIGALEELLQGKTALIVTHRYAIIEHADYIYCLDGEGKVVESGTPVYLYEKQGYYYAMHHSQNKNKQLAVQNT